MMTLIFILTGQAKSRRYLIRKSGQHEQHEQHGQNVQHGQHGQYGLHGLHGQHSRLGYLRQDGVGDYFFPNHFPKMRVCNSSVDCRINRHCRGLADAGCVCKFGECTTVGFYWGGRR